MSSSAPSRADLARHAGYEFLSTTVLLFGVVSLVRLLALPDSPLAIRDAHLMLGTAGAVVALLLAALMYAPTGRASGGHFNPGVTVFLWADGLFPGRAVLPYVAAQLAGSVSGPALARLVWGDPVLRIHYALVAPAPGTGTTALFLIETAALIAVLAAVAVSPDTPGSRGDLLLGYPVFRAVVPVAVASPSAASGEPTCPVLLRRLAHRGMESVAVRCAMQAMGRRAGRLKARRSQQDRWDTWASRRRS
ncbi:aquaporin [Streptomyces diastatochromogenes]|uniref:Aquaporin family protein n=1 Tax=Streptomyces diastatochromogenes TaxID=42236 RepID=A0A233S8B3_STRDA|nr:aquaporin [Streptomyces diastatochromogenes]OXY91883.1 hypothetical protein BEK98_27670 [Streptomyces diastatochromogenes]